MASERTDRFVHTGADASTVSVPTGAAFSAEFRWIKAHGQLDKEYDADGGYTVIAKAAGCSRQMQIVPPESPGDYETAVVEIVRELRAYLGPLGK